MSTSYGTNASRAEILKVLAWSFNALRHAVAELEDLVHRSGEGVYPSCDAFGKTFSPTFDRERHQLAGERVAGNFVACLDGIQADQEFVAKLFRPTKR